MYDSATNHEMDDICKNDARLETDNMQIDVKAKGQNIDTTNTNESIDIDDVYLKADVTESVAFDGYENLLAVDLDNDELFGLDTDMNSDFSKEIEYNVNEAMGDTYCNVVSHLKNNQESNIGNGSESNAERLEEKGEKSDGQRDDGFLLWLKTCTVTVSSDGDYAGGKGIRYSNVLLLNYLMLIICNLHDRGFHDRGK